MAVFYKNRAYLFEFKVVEFEPEGKALEQIKRKKQNIIITAAL